MPTIEKVNSVVSIILFVQEEVIICLKKTYKNLYIRNTHLIENHAQDAVSVGLHFIIDKFIFYLAMNSLSVRVNYRIFHFFHDINVKILVS